MLYTKQHLATSNTPCYSVYYREVDSDNNNPYRETGRITYRTKTLVQKIDFPNCQQETNQDGVCDDRYQSNKEKKSEKE
jgi:hypothetical protein